MADQVGVPSQFDTGKSRFFDILTFHILLVKLTATADVVTEFTAPYDGAIIATFWITGKAVTTGGKSATLNVEIGSADVAGGVVSLTSATVTPMGKVLAGTTVTNGGNFAKGEKVSVKTTMTAAFSEGDGTFCILVQGETR